MDPCLTTYTKINGGIKNLSAKIEIIEVFVENMGIFFFLTTRRGMTLRLTPHQDHKKKDPLQHGPQCSLEKGQGHGGLSEESSEVGLLSQSAE